MFYAVMRLSKFACCTRVSVAHSPKQQAVAVSASAYKAVLGGSWVVVNGVLSRLAILTSHIRGLITPTYNPKP